VCQLPDFPFVSPGKAPDSWARKRSFGPIRGVRSFNYLQRERAANREFRLVSSTKLLRTMSNVLRRVCSAERPRSRPGRGLVSGQRAQKYQWKSGCDMQAPRSALNTGANSGTIVAPADLNSQKRPGPAWNRRASWGARHPIEGTISSFSFNSPRSQGRVLTESAGNSANNRIVTPPPPPIRMASSFACYATIGAAFDVGRARRNHGRYKARLFSGQPPVDISRSIWRALACTNCVPNRAGLGAGSTRACGAKRWGQGGSLRA